MTIRIGLTQRLEWLESRQEMREMLDAAWAAGLSALGAVPIALPTRGRDPRWLLEHYGIDVLLLTGGNESGAAATDLGSKERNAFEFGLLRVAQEMGTPVFGVCHGMQAMNLYLGGKVSFVEEHVRVSHAVVGVAAKVFGIGRSNSFHNIGIQLRDAAPDWVIAGCAPDGSVETLVHREWSWLGVMWHPERAMPDGVDGMAVVAAFVADPVGLCRRLREEASR